MKNYLYLLLLSIFIISCSKPEKKTIEFVPSRPKEGEMIKVYYDNSKGKLKNEKTIYIRAYFYSYDEPVMKEYLMKKNNDRFYAEFEADKNFDGAVVIFVDSAFNVKDNNDDAGYKISFYDKNQKPKRFSESGYASFLAWYGYNFQAIEMNRDSAVKIFEKEFEKDEDLKKYYIFEYYRSIRRLNPEKFKEIALKDYEKFLRDENLSEKQLEALYLLGNWIIQDIIQNSPDMSLDEKESKKKIIEQANEILLTKIEEKNPNNSLLLNAKFDRIMKIEDKKIREKAFLDFEKEHFDSDVLRYYYYGEVKKLIAEKKYEQAINLLYDKKHILKEYALAFVGELVKNTKNFSKIKEIVNLEEQRLDKNKRDKIFDKETLKIYGERLSESFFKFGDYQILQAKATIALAENNEKEAYDLLANRKDITFEFSDLLGIYAKLSSKYNPNEFVLSEIIEKMKKITPDRDLIDNVKSLYTAVKGSDKDFDKVILELQQSSEASLMEQLLKEEINYLAPDFTLYDLDGNKVSLKDFKNKILILDFWATWCGPCRQSFPAMQKAVDKYANDNDVKFLFINAWENAEDKKENASNFIKSNGYRFQVLLDETNEVISKYKVSGIPTKVFIDKKGNIRFKIAGFSGEEMALKEIDMIVNYLR